MALLARSLDSENAAAATFPLADAIRSRSVQLALTLSGARAVAGSPELAELARREQDMAKQLAAQRELLNDFLARSRERRRSVHSRATDANRRAEGRARWHASATCAGISGLCQSDRSPSAHGGCDQERSQAWRSIHFVLFRQGAQFCLGDLPHKPLAFATIDTTANDIAAKVKRLRSALEPQAALVSDIPPFDLTLAYELTACCSSRSRPAGKRPRAWSSRPTERSACCRSACCRPGHHRSTRKPTRYLPAIATCPGWRAPCGDLIPSASALVTLRRCRPARPRHKLIAFGDPYFSAQEAARPRRRPSPPTRVASTAAMRVAAPTH